MRLKFILYAVAALSCLPRDASAENYPDRPIRLIVPTGTGGAADIISRMIAEKLQTSFGEPVVIEDRPGANGIVGASYVLSAPADGYMLMMGHIGLMTINNHIYKDVRLNPLTDFAPVTLATTYPNLLVVNNKLPIHSVSELVQYAKQNPDALKYSSSGFGASFHMAFELLKAQAGINAVHVPYTGTAVALTAVIAGNVDAAFTDTITSAPQVASNTLRGIAISSKKRAKTLPDVPTVAESGVPGLADFEVVGWNGIVVKTGTPPERIKLLNEHIRRALSSPDVVERISKLGADVAADTPEEFGEFMRNEDAKWGNLAKTARLMAVE